MVTKEDVLRVAKLARLSIAENDLPKIQEKFSAILDHFEFLSEVDTSNVEPLYHAVDAMSPRPDVTEPAIARADLLKNAPEEFESCFKIPRVVGAAE